MKAACTDVTKMAWNVTTRSWLRCGRQRLQQWTENGEHGGDMISRFSPFWLTSMSAVAADQPPSGQGARRASDNKQSRFSSSHKGQAAHHHLRSLAASVDGTWSTISGSFYSSQGF